MHSIRLFVSFLLPVFVLVGIGMGPAAAQDKTPAANGQATTKVVAENDKLRVYELWYKPGDVNQSVPNSSLRVVRALRGGTLMRMHSDGKNEKVEWKTGEVKINTPTEPYTSKNIGKTELVLYIVLLK